MANSYFRFKKFTVRQDACAMKVTTDACLFGAWCAAQLAMQASAGKTVLDIGTGTGLLSLMVRQKNEVEIDAVEIDEAAAAQAQQNVTESPWPKTINVIHSDLLRMSFSKSYDYIISNPPFYERELQSPDHRHNTAHHSTQLPLQALLQFIVQHLQPQGIFFLLLPYKRVHEIRSLLQENNLHIQQEVTVRQTEAHAPFRIMLQGGFEKHTVNTSTIVIAGADQQYTTDFTILLKDYYLYL